MPLVSVQQKLALLCQDVQQQWGRRQSHEGLGSVRVMSSDSTESTYKALLARRCMTQQAEIEYIGGIAIDQGISLEVDLTVDL